MTSLWRNAAPMNYFRDGNFRYISTNEDTVQQRRSQVREFGHGEKFTESSELCLDYLVNGEDI
jgi:hypothetical protein